MSDRVEQTEAMKQAALEGGNLGAAIVAANLQKWAEEAEAERTAETD